MLKRLVHGVTLQQSDTDRVIISVITYTDTLTKGFHGACPGTGATHDVFFEDEPRCADGVAVGDHPDESGNIDPGRAGLRAGGIEAEVAPLGLYPRRILLQRRMHLTIIALTVRLFEAARCNPRLSVMRCCN